MVFVVGACLALGLLTVFAIELSDNQARSKSGIEDEVHQRAQLAGSFITGLIQGIPKQYQVTYGSGPITNQILDQKLGTNVYLALLSPDGTKVLASSSGFNAQARSNLSKSEAVALVRSGHSYGLGNLLPYGSTGVIDVAVPITSQGKNAILLTGSAPKELALFTGELNHIPGVNGAHSYLLDGNGTVLATNNPAAQVGRVIPGTDALQGLQQTSGDRDGRYLNQAVMKNSDWRILISSPDGPLFASVTGLHQVLPWLIFGAFAIVAMVALVLGYRVLRSSDQLRSVNSQLEQVNVDLTGANATLQRRAAELARSNEELDQFASIASHDLQEPLRKVRTFTEQLVVTEGDRLSETGHDYLERTNAAAERMQRLVEDLLRFRE